jgi:hypothetical protein
LAYISIFDWDYVLGDLYLVGHAGDIPVSLVVKISSLRSSRKPLQLNSGGTPTNTAVTLSSFSWQNLRSSLQELSFKDENLMGVGAVRKQEPPAI